MDNHFNNLMNDIIQFINQHPNNDYDDIILVIRKCENCVRLFLANNTNYDTCPRCLEAYNFENH